MVENVYFTEGKKEGAVDCALENPSVFTPTVNEELTMIGPPCLLPKSTKNSFTEKELKTTLHALNSISYFNVRGTYTQYW